MIINGILWKVLKVFSETLGMSFNSRYLLNFKLEYRNQERTIC